MPKTNKELTIEVINAWLNTYSAAALIPDATTISKVINEIHNTISKLPKD